MNNNNALRIMQLINSKINNRYLFTTYKDSALILLHLLTNYNKYKTRIISTRTLGNEVRKNIKFYKPLFKDQLNTSLNLLKNKHRWINTFNKHKSKRFSSAFKWLRIMEYITYEQDSTNNTLCSINYEKILNDLKSFDNENIPLIRNTTPQPNRIKTNTTLKEHFTHWIEDQRKNEVEQKIVEILTTIQLQNLLESNVLTKIYIWKEKDLDKNGKEATTLIELPNSLGRFLESL